MHHTDPAVERIARGGDGDGLAIDKNLTLIGVVDARDHIHQGGLAAAVFAQHRQYLAPANR